MENRIRKFQIETFYHPCLCLILIIFSCKGVHAQLEDWSFVQKINISNDPGIEKTNYQVLLTLNTQTLITAGQMQSNGNDIRFSKDCDGNTLYNYWIESGINTQNTQIWVQIDTLVPNSNRIIFMHFGNSSASGASDFEITFPNRLIVTGTTTATNDIWNYDWVEITALAKVTPPTDGTYGRLIINARKIIVAGELHGEGFGFLGGSVGDGSGAGKGFSPHMIKPKSTGGGGGGASYGGAGGAIGNSCANAKLSVTYGDTSSISIEAGSGGAASVAVDLVGKMSPLAPGGNGGAIFTLNATSIEIPGIINANGSNGTSAHASGGGGSGGGIMLKGYNINITGTLSAKGGSAGTSGTCSGGSGGGGRIKIFYQNSYSNTGITLLEGGTDSPPTTHGTPGTFFLDTFNSGAPAFTLVPIQFAVTTANTTICQGVSADFTADSGYINYDFILNGTIMQSSAANFFSTSSLMDKDTLWVIATHTDCLEMSNKIIMKVLPNPVANAGTDTTVCKGSSTVIGGAPTGTGSTGPYSYNWVPSVGLNSAITANPIARPSLNTVYTVTVADINGCKDTSSVELNIPVTSVSPSFSAFCEGNAVQLEASGADTYNWFPSTGLNAISGSTVTASPAITTTYTIIGTFDVGCTDTNYVNVTVNSLPPANAGSDVTICQGETTELTASGGTNYFWSPPDSLSCTNCANPVADPSATTSYMVTVTDSNGCEETDSVTIYVNSILIADAGSDTSICKGSSVLLNASGGTSYSWSPSTGLSCTNCANPVASPLYSTTYTVTVSHSTCAPGNDSAVVQVDSLPVANAGQNEKICQGNSIQLITSGGVNYTWYPSTGLDDPNIANPIAAPNVTTDYIVIVEGVNGCTVADTITIEVEVCSGIAEEMRKTDMKLFPNPTNYALNISILNAAFKQLKIEVFDIYGRMVYNKDAGKMSGDYIIQIKISSFPQGIYYLKLKDDTFFILEKFIVQM